MSWRRIVIRPDSIIRWWSLAQLDCPGGFSKVVDSPYLSTIDFNSLVAISDGSEHIKMNEFASLSEVLVKVSADHPSLFQDIGRHYEEVMMRWLTFSATLSERDLLEASQVELGELLSSFTALTRSSLRSCSCPSWWKGVTRQNSLVWLGVWRIESGFTLNRSRSWTATLPRSFWVVRIPSSRIWSGPCSNTRRGAPSPNRRTWNFRFWLRMPSKTRAPLLYLQPPRSLGGRAFRRLRRNL